MQIKDAPLSPAYVVFHDAYMNGAMDVWPCTSLAIAQAIAKQRQTAMEQMGQDECGIYRAYEKLPRVRVWKFHSEKGETQ